MERIPCKNFFFKDKTNDFAIIVIAPHNDKNCKPFDFYRLGHAKIASLTCKIYLRDNCHLPIPDSILEQYFLEETDAFLNEQLAQNQLNPKIHELLSNNSLSKKEQENLLRGLSLNASDIIWLNKDAQDLGYLLDVYHEETYPEKFNEKHRPVCYNQNDNGTMHTIGETDMTDGELRALLEQRKVVQARIYHRENI